MELKRSLKTLDVDNLSEEEKARQLRLLSLRERVGTGATAPSAPAPSAAPAGADGAGAAAVDTPAPATAPDGNAGLGGAPGGAAAGGAAATPASEAVARDAADEAGEGTEVNAFLKSLVEKKRARHHQLQIIQDFFENPVEFGVEIDYIPSGTPLSEIKARMKELRYRMKLLNSVLDSFKGELAMLEQAERSALSPADPAAGDAPGARTRQDIRPARDDTTSGK